MSMNIEVQKYKAKSSPALRAKAQESLDTCKARLSEITAEQTARDQWAKELLKAARFVVDVNGDSPSMDELRQIVETAEYQVALSEELRQLGKEIDQLRGQASYYQYVAGSTRGNAGFSYFVVAGSGDTRKEALKNAR